MNPTKPAGETYTIQIEGHLNPGWVEWPCPVETQQATDAHGKHAITILTATLPDQPALHALLEMIRDLNLKLVSFHRMDQADFIDKK